MTRQSVFKQVKLFWKSNNTTLILAIFLVVFTGYAFFIAVNLGLDIIPDEPYHFSVSLHFSETWSIPENVPTARSLGVEIRQNPTLAYWLFGRALSLYEHIQPAASNRQQLVFLRIVNTFFSIGTVIFTYLISKELIKHKWWQLLPVFVLTNTLMFVFLSGGVSYDNPANMLSAAGLYFLVRVLNKKNFITNSLGWLICIALGTLTKETLLPLALAMTVVWVIFLFRNRPTINLTIIKNIKTGILIFILLLTLAANFSLYGVNIIRYQSLMPSCRDNFSEEYCASTAFAVCRQQLALDEKPNVYRAFRQGYPEPIRYAFDTWIRAMLMKIFGIMGGQKSYYPLSIAYYHILFYWMIALGLRYYREKTFNIYGLTGIFIFYALVLFIKNYDIELAYGFIQVAHQGRYIFPVLSIPIVLLSYMLMNVPRKWIRLLTLMTTILLFIYGGPIRFLLHYNTVFAEWFI